MRTDVRTYVALLRGINVGGHNKIKMADLKQMFERLGLARVKTYIQSGNVLFQSAEDERVLQQQIERAISMDFGIQVTVVLRRNEELERIVHNCPFSEEEVAAAKTAAQVECLYVALLTQPPALASIERLKRGTAGGDAFHVAGRDIYLLFRHGLRDSNLASQLQKLDEPSTVRNWNTTCKLVAMAQELTAAR